MKKFICSVSAVARRPGRLRRSHFTAAVERWLLSPATVLVIAGAAGAGTRLKQCADETVALSALTFPHTLVRLLCWWSSCFAPTVRCAGSRIRAEYGAV